MALERTQGSERPRDVNATLRALHAIDLIAAGHTYAEAAHLAGYGSRGACHDAVQRELGRVVIQHVDTLRKMQLRRFQRMRKVYVPKAEAGDLSSAEYLRRLDERESALMGIDASKTDPSGASTEWRIVGVAVEGI